MMTREEVTAYLDKMAEAKKQLTSPPNTEIPFFDNEVWPIVTLPDVHMMGVMRMCRILGRPIQYLPRKYSEPLDHLGYEAVMYWNGVKFFQYVTRRNGKWVS